MSWLDATKAAAKRGDPKAKKVLREHEARLEKRVSKVEAQHRTKLFDDYGASAELRGRLANTPIDKLRGLLEAYTAPASAAKRSAPSVTKGPTHASPHADAMDQIMGTASTASHVIDDRNTRSIRLMTPSQARAHVKALEARKARGER